METRMIGLIALAPLIAEVAAHAPPQPVGIPVWVEAAPGTAYIAKCHIRSFKGPLGLYTNTYYIDSKGPFKDRIPSPNAQCVFTKKAGEGPATLHIQKNGDHAATADAAGRWVRLNVW
jgi:hypothetical protein